MTESVSTAVDAVKGALQSQLSVDNLVGIIVAVLGVTVVFGVIWFATGYVRRRVSGAFKNGNI